MPGGQLPHRDVMASVTREKDKRKPMTETGADAVSSQSVCPKCGHTQPLSEECLKCGIIFKKHFSRPPSINKTYKVKSSLLLLFALAAIFSFAASAWMFSMQNNPAAGAQAAVFLSIFPLAFGVVFIFVVLQGLNYTVVLTPAGLKISGVPFIAWDSIFDVEWLTRKVRLSPSLPKKYEMTYHGIELSYIDKNTEKATRVLIVDKVKDLRGLYEEIEKRMNKDLYAVYLPEGLNVRKMVVYGICFTAILFIFLTFLYKTSIP